MNQRDDHEEGNNDTDNIAVLRHNFFVAKVDKENFLLFRVEAYLQIPQWLKGDTPLAMKERWDTVQHRRDEKPQLGEAETFHSLIMPSGGFCAR